MSQDSNTIAAPNKALVPLTVKSLPEVGQFSIDGDLKGCKIAFNEAYVSFSGYFGAYGPHVFAAAPKLLLAAQRLAARGFFTPSSCADKATLKDMTSMLDAIAEATGAKK